MVNIRRRGQALIRDGHKLSKIKIVNLLNKKLGL